MAVRVLKKLTCMVTALVVVGGMTGCGNSPRNKVVPVQGKIAFASGKPLPAGTRLQFNPASGRMAGASGVTETDGSFSVKHTYGLKGAEVGKYVITLQAPERDAGDFYKLIPKEYYDGGALTIEVTDGMPAVNLVVKKS